MPKHLGAEGSLLPGKLAEVEHGLLSYIAVDALQIALERFYLVVIALDSVSA